MKNIFVPKESALQKRGERDETENIYQKAERHYNRGSLSEQSTRGWWIQSKVLHLHRKGFCAPERIFLSGFMGPRDAGYEMKGCEFMTLTEKATLERLPLRPVRPSP